MARSLLLLLLLVVTAVPSRAQTEDPVPPQDVTSTAPIFGTDFESVDAELQGCPKDKISFEMVTGFVYSSPADMLDSLPGTLKITDCLEMCRNNASCMAVNYETGLCVLFSSNADIYPGALTTSDFPVFTLYVQKNCLTDAPVCGRAWGFERVMGFQLDGFSRKTEKVTSRIDCQTLCLTETDFPCRSANFNNESLECSISDMDRHTVVGSGSFQRAENIDFLENNCVDDPVRLCEFQKMSGRILKTVDSVFQEVESLDECKQLCLEAPYRCHSFDYNDTGDKVCRLSHHAAATLTHINDPYLELADSSTYELSSCYNVTIDCRSGDMVARIKTSKIFNGKIYSKGSPTTCVNDIKNSLEFEIEMSYNDVECNVKRDSASRYSSDIVIQHHDTIVTSADLGLSVHCQYDLSNKSVSNRVDLQVTGEIEPALEEESIVESPNVIMRITDRGGEDIVSAAVGDMLELRFEIVDKNSPYEILVRDLIAMEGGEGNQIELLDSRGCPVELSILRPLLKVDETGKVLGATFDAFKFPTSETVQFRALVTPCIPFCEPVVCNITDFSGQVQQTESYGRKKRSLASSPNARVSRSQVIRWLTSKHIDVEGFGVPQEKAVSLQTRYKRETQTEVPDEHLVVQTITITDKFGFRGKNKSPKKVSGTKSQSTNSGRSDDDMDGAEEELVLTEALSGSCMNTIGLILGCSVFLVAQLVLIVAWTAVWHRRRRNKMEEPLSASTTTESLRQLYDSGYPRRVFYTPGICNPKKMKM